MLQSGDNHLIILAGVSLYKLLQLILEIPLVRCILNYSFLNVVTLTEFIMKNKFCSVSGVFNLRIEDDFFMFTIVFGTIHC